MAVIHKTYQVRAYTNAVGYNRLDRVLRNCAVLYNAALEEWQSAYRHKGHALSASRTKFDQMKELTGIREDDPEFWGAISLQIARGVIVRLERARQSFFRRVQAGETPGYPRFKSSRRWRTIELAEVSPSMVKSNDKHYMVRVKGLPTIRLRRSRELPDAKRLKALTITKRGRRLWVSHDLCGRAGSAERKRPCGWAGYGSYQQDRALHRRGYIEAQQAERQDGARSAKAVSVS